MPYGKFSEQKDFWERQDKDWVGVKGKDCKAKTIFDNEVVGWLPSEGTEKYNQYWCHGYSLKTFKKFGYSLYGSSVPVVLKDEYFPLEPNEIKKGDVISFHNFKGEIIHTARIKDPKKPLSETMVKTKNGPSELETCKLKLVQGVYPSAVKLKFWRPMNKIIPFGENGSQY